MVQLRILTFEKLNQIRCRYGSFQWPNRKFKSTHRLRTFGLPFIWLKSDASIWHVASSPHMVRKLQFRTQLSWPRRPGCCRWPRTRPTEQSTSGYDPCRCTWIKHRFTLCSTRNGFSVWKHPNPIMFGLGIIYAWKLYCRVNIYII